MIEFSVVIAVYNKEKYLAATLASVAEQRYKNFELIIINDGSTDNSEAVINSFLHDTRIRYFSQENQGVSAARNAAIKKATKPFIALLDGDDLWKSKHLETIVNLINAYPDQAAFATNSVIREGKKELAKRYSIALDSGVQIVNFFKASLIDSIVNSSTLVVKREVFDQVGYYNPQILSGEDTDFFIRLGAKHAIVFDPNVTVTVLRLKNSLSKKRIALENRLPLDAYTTLEATNPEAKVFLDLNRYSYCLEEKLHGNRTYAKRLSNQIDSKNLSKRQRFLVALPSFGLKLMYGLKNVLQSLGIRLTAFG